VSTVDNTRDYARVSHSTQWSNYNIISFYLFVRYTAGRLVTLPVEISVQSPVIMR